MASSATKRDAYIKSMDWYIAQFKPKSIIDTNINNIGFIESAFYSGLKDLSKLKGYSDKNDFIEAQLSEFRPYIENLGFQFYISFEDKYDCAICIIDSMFYLEYANVIVSNLSRLLEKKGQILFCCLDEEDEQNTNNIWAQIFLSYGLKSNNKMSSYIGNIWQSFGMDKDICEKLIVFNY